MSVPATRIRGASNVAGMLPARSNGATMRLVGGHEMMLHHDDEGRRFVPDAMAANVQPSADRRPDHDSASSAARIRRTLSAKLPYSVR